jgi:hypothetical protein
MGFKRHRRPECNLWFGVFILAAGFLWLLDSMGVFFLPHWVFTWKFLLIGIGFLIGLSRRFRGAGWLVPVIVGGVFLLEDIPSIEFDVRQYAFPVVIIAIGFLITYKAITSRGRQGDASKDHARVKTSFDMGTEDPVAQVSSDDVIDIRNQFASVKRKIISKNFKGGKISSSFGNVELDLSQADIDGIVTIHIDQTFSGLELVIPANWDVKPEVSITLAGIEENRNSVVPSPNKVLVLTGSCTLSGIEIKSYS